MSGSTSLFSVAEPSLGYVFQSRYALLRMFDLPEDGEVYIERNDDVEFVAVDGSITLGSLKHKADGNRLSDLSVDFWKSVRVWVAHYKSSGRVGSTARPSQSDRGHRSAGQTCPHEQVRRRGEPFGCAAFASSLRRRRRVLEKRSSVSFKSTQKNLNRYDDKHIGEAKHARSTIGCH